MIGNQQTNPVPNEEDHHQDIISVVGEDNTTQHREKATTFQSDDLTRPMLSHQLPKPSPFPSSRKSSIFTSNSYYSTKGSTSTSDKGKSNLCRCECPKGVRIVHCLLIVFIVQGVLGLLTSILLLYTSGNQTLSRVSQNQAFQTQLFVNIHVSTIIDTSESVLQQIYLELDSGLDVYNFTSWVLLFKYIRGLYVPSTPLSILQLGTFNDHYIGVNDINQTFSVLEFLNNTNTLYRYHNHENDLRSDPLVASNLLSTSYFPYLPTDRPWFRAFQENAKDTVSPRWSEIFFSVYGKPSINLAFPIYIKANTTAVRLGLSQLTPNNSMLCRDKSCYTYDHLYGVVGILFSLEGLGNFLNSTLQQYPNLNYCFIMDPNGVIIASSKGDTQNNTTQELVDVNREILAYAQHIMRNNMTNAKSDTFFLNGKNIFVSTITDKYNLMWRVVIVYNQSDFVTELFASGITSLVVYIIIMVGGTLLLFILVQAMNNPLRNVKKKLDKLVKLKNMNESEEEKRSVFSDISALEQSISSLRRGINTFSKYVHQNFMKRVLSGQYFAEIGMDVQNMTILCSDLVSFTELAESTDSEILLSVMTEYFSAMTTTLEHHHGFIEKYVGDGIRALWSSNTHNGLLARVEQHEIRACRAVTEMLEVFHDLNKAWKEKGYPQLDMRVGINSGEVYCGSMGCLSRLSFGVIGVNVNIASKLERLNREYSTTVLIGESTYNHVKDHFVCNYVDNMEISGKSIAFYSLECSNKEATDLQIKISRDFLLIQRYSREGDYASVIRVCQNILNLQDSPVAMLMLSKAKAKLFKPKTE
ncbi:hypothetical protein C9374_013547 [Naegleria lovaniensis]|uniref:Guanylate cyclase domain-containing protein n=1 Tax=Naegleria lovaniensis TaxID=51637 RepID=A0AA88KQ89_NAELO|nr:uncharacterized protein C9374_013547 [Naegleria lovaniensis]KAG2392062.1 hypothetical protein C9374_013547 [Naegleria lovaniensis]